MNQKHSIQFIHSFNIWEHQITYKITLKIKTDPGFLSFNDGKVYDNDKEGGGEGEGQGQHWPGKGGHHHIPLRPQRRPRQGHAPR